MAAHRRSCQHLTTLCIFVCKCWFQSHHSLPSIFSLSSKCPLLLLFIFLLSFFTISLTFFLWCGGLFVPSLLVGCAAVSLLLQDVADKDAQQAHHAEDGHQSENGVLCCLLLGAANHCAVDWFTCTSGWTFTHRANCPDMQKCCEKSRRRDVREAGG